MTYFIHQEDQGYEGGQDAALDIGNALGETTSLLSIGSKIHKIFQSRTVFVTRVVFIHFRWCEIVEELFITQGSHPASGSGFSCLYNFSLYDLGNIQSFTPSMSLMLGRHRIVLVRDVRTVALLSRSIRVAWITPHRCCNPSHHSGFLSVA